MVNGRSGQWQNWLVFVDDEKFLFTYFDNTYGRGKMLANGRRIAPQYCVKEWNVYENIADSIERTNNAQEGYHNQLKVLAGRPHLDVHQFIQMLIQQNCKLQRNIKTHLANGARERKLSKAMVAKTSNIMCLDERYAAGEMSMLDYMYGIGQNLKM